MSTTEVGRRHGAMPWLTPGMRLVMFGLGVMWAVVLSLTVGRWVTGGGWSIAGSATAVGEAVSGRFPPAGTLAAAAVVLAVLLAVGLLLARLLRRPPAAPVGMADRNEVRRVAGVAAARAAAEFSRRAAIRDGRLDVKTCPVNQVGWHLGGVQGLPDEPVVLTHQTQTAVIGPTGMGKTRYALQGAAHDAPGALIITTTKLADYAAVLRHRATLGRVFVWDPIGAAGWPTRTVWNPVAGCTNGDVAHARGRAFTGDPGEGDSTDGAAKFFGDSAALVFTRLLMAADLDGRTMMDVRRWAARLRRSGSEPVNILTRKLPAEPEWAETLQHQMTDGKTTENLQMTLALKVEPLMSQNVMAALVPAPLDKTAMLLDPHDFVRSTDTLVLVTDDNARINVSELTTMLLSELTDAAKLYAQELGGPLDPPMRVVADEVANVAPLPKLPSMLSDSRGAGMHWVLALQSLAAVKSRWGDAPGKVILSNLNAVVVLGGLQDTDALERFASLAGKVEVNEHTGTQGGGRDGSQTWSRQERDVLRTEEIAHLGEGEALVVLRNARPILVDLMPYDRRS